MPNDDKIRNRISSGNAVRIKDPKIVKMLLDQQAQIEAINQSMQENPQGRIDIPRDIFQQMQEQETYSKGESRKATSQKSTENIPVKESSKIFSFFKKNNNEKFDSQNPPATPNNPKVKKSKKEGPKR